MHHIQIHLQGHDQTQVDNAVRSLVETLDATEARFTGPLLLPSHENDGLYHRRVVDVTHVGRQTLPRLQDLSLPGGVLIDIKAG